MLVIYSDQSIFWSAASNALILFVLYLLPFQHDTWGKYISEETFQLCLLAYGVLLSVHYVRKWHRRPASLLLDSCRKGDLAGVRQALDAGSCINQPEGAGEGALTPLMLAVSTRSIKVLELLLKKPAIDVKHKDEDGWTALTMACALGNCSAVLRLARYYSAMKEVEEEADTAMLTPLMWCVRLGQTECFKELAAFPWVDLDAKDILGRSLEDMAREKGNMEIQRVITEIRGNRRGQHLYAQRRLKTERVREMKREQEKRELDHGFIEIAKRELKETVTNFIVTNQYDENNQYEDRIREQEERKRQHAENRRRASSQPEVAESAAKDMSSEAILERILGSKKSQKDRGRVVHTNSPVEYGTKTAKKEQQTNNIKQESTEVVLDDASILSHFSASTKEKLATLLKADSEKKHEKEKNFVDKLNEETKRYSPKAENLKVNIERLKLQVSREKEKIEELTSGKAKDISIIVVDISEAEDINRTREKQVERVDVEIKEHESSIAKLRSEKQKLTNECGKSFEQIEKLTKKRMKLEKSIDMEMKKYLESDAKLKKELKILESKLEGLENESEPLATAEPGKHNSTMVAFLRQAIEGKEKDLECPVCLETAASPIFSCPESHVICSLCRPKVGRCPECRVSYKGPPRRHRFAEKTAGELEALRHQLLLLTT